MRDLDLERRELCAQLLLGKLGRAEPGAPALDLGRRRLGRPCREFVLSTALLTFPQLLPAALQACAASSAPAMKLAARWRRVLPVGEVSWGQ